MQCMYDCTMCVAKVWGLSQWALTTFTTDHFFGFGGHSLGVRFLMDGPCFFSGGGGPLSAYIDKQEQWEEN